VLDDSEHGTCTAPFTGKKDAYPTAPPTWVIVHRGINRQGTVFDEDMEPVLSIFTAPVEDFHGTVVQPFPVTRGTVQYRISHDIR